MLYYVGNGTYLRAVAESFFDPDNHLSSLKKLYVAYQTSIQKMILIYVRIPSYLPCYNSAILLGCSGLVSGLLLLHLCSKMVSTRLNGKRFYFTL